MKKLSKIIIVACISTLSMSAFGQDLRNAYQKAVDKIFSGIPAEKVTTGILIERAPTFVNMFLYERSNKEIMDTCNVNKWKQMHLQLNMAYMDSRKFNYDNRIIETNYQEKSNSGDIPLGIIFYDYNRIDPNALDKGFLSIDTVKGVVKDISSKNNTPLTTVTCFAASPMVEILQPGAYSFYLEPSLFISNKTQLLNEISIDLGDGKGFVSLPVGDKVSVYFDKPGVHILTIKAIQKEITYISHSAVYVEETKISLRAGALGADPERTPNIKVENFTTGAGANAIKAEYGIWYRCNHDNTLRKPLLIVSGYDPSDVNRVWENASDGNKINDKRYLYHVANKVVNNVGFLDNLRKNGYDIIVYRSLDSKKSIVDNGLNLVALIQHINNIKTTNNELVVVGASMGGLVARYALTYMENQNMDHKTRLFVSLDSPQNGANVPLGMQYMIASLADDLNGLISINMLQDAKNEMLGCVAAKEMLLYHYTATSGNTAQYAPERTAFLSNLASKGNFPQKCQSLAISMGSGTAVNQGFSPGQTILKKNQSIIGSTFLYAFGIQALVNSIVSLLPGSLGIPSWSDLTWEFEVKSVPNHTSQTIYTEKISIKIHILLPPFIFTENLASRSFTVNNTEPLDNAPGSTQGLHNMTDFDLVDKQAWLDIIAFLGGITKDSNRDCFIPAYSTLGLSVTPHTHIKNYLNANMVKINNNDRFYRNNNKTISPFDYLYIEESNMYHISDPNKNSALTASMVTMMNEFLIPSQYNIESRTIKSGQSVGYEMPGKVTVGAVVVESGGRLDIKAASISLDPGFEAKAGSLVNMNVDTSWICP